MPSADNREQREEDDHADSEPQRVLYDCENNGTPQLRFLHFNDVYHPQYARATMFEWIRLTLPQAERGGAQGRSGEIEEPLRLLPQR